ncbi:hypothetical protein IWQ60_003263 [Tieghemiomyces parasiticus]|uniref:Uncharacterized protein n=1 Tax=Tieghemiomyces parasiticus TaxID=78921 RepID=A0A9W8E089_9FUNG|nr:hypothetical protein IWQ60_003263 [Tieghemiomyces parasiticus]
MTTHRHNLLPDGVLDFIAGSMAGVGQTVVGQPFDTVKTRMQIQGSTAHYKGPLDCAIQTVRNEGPLGLYKVLFAAYSRLREFQKRHPDDTLRLHQIALAGAGAGAANAWIVSPVELIKIRLQGQFTSTSTGGSTSTYCGPFEIARDLYRHQGLRAGLMRGFWVTLVREIPANAGFYAGFEGAKRWLAGDTHSPANLPLTRLLLAGACGGVCYWSCCYPIDVVKSTAQFGTRPLSPRGRYMLDGACEVYRLQGWRGFTRGLAPSILRALPAAATTFSLYELTSRFLKGT